MANEFDLERAKRGDAIEALYAGEWKLGHFCGLTFHGIPIVQMVMSNGAWSASYPENATNIRMKPKPPKTMWIQLYRNGYNDILCTNPRKTQDEARFAAGGCKLVDDPQAVLVPDES